MTFMVAAIVLLYVLVSALAVLVIVLYRQFGMVYLGSRRHYETMGPAVGDSAPTGLRVASPDQPDNSMELDWQAVPSGGGTLLLLGGQACTACVELLQHMNHAPALATGAARILYIDQGPGDLPGTKAPVPTDGRWEHWRSIDVSVHRAFDVEVSPFAFAVDNKGIIRAKGIVSNPQMITALLNEAGLAGSSNGFGLVGGTTLTVHQEVS